MRKAVCLILALLFCASFACTAFASETGDDFVASPGGTEPDCPHHNMTVVGQKDPTCTTFGYTGDHVCDDCGKLIEEGKDIPKLNHDFENGTCTNCGTVEDNPKTGDASRIGLWIVVMIIAAVALGGVAIVYGKKFSKR